MSRIPTFRNNFDDLRKLSLADLKRLGYMVSNSRCSGSIKWTRRGETTGTMGVTVCLLSEDGYVELEYTYNSQESIKYRVELVQILSNLGKGQIWYFICPLTGERCRTLYQFGKNFASRKAQPKTLYESQTYSKYYRWLDNTFGPKMKLDNIYDELYKRYAKKHYRGKPTPMMKKALNMERAYNMVKEGESRSLEEYIFG